MQGRQGEQIEARRETEVKEATRKENSITSRSVVPIQERTVRRLPGRPGTDLEHQQAQRWAPSRWRLFPPVMFHPERDARGSGFIFLSQILGNFISYFILFISFLLRTFLPHHSSLQLFPFLHMAVNNTSRIRLKRSLPLSTQNTRQPSHRVCAVLHLDEMPESGGYSHIPVTSKYTEWIENHCIHTPIKDSGRKERGSKKKHQKGKDMKKVRRRKRKSGKPQAGSTNQRIRKKDEG
jgi:hypothetical protein